MNKSLCKNLQNINKNKSGKSGATEKSTVLLPVLSCLYKKIRFPSHRDSRVDCGLFDLSKQATT